MANPADDAYQILEAAFTKAFSPPPSRRQSVEVPAKASLPTEHTTEVPQSSEQTPANQSAEEGRDSAWKLEYEEQVKTWRAQSAEAREKAEKVREQWEAKRFAEREDAAKATGTPGEPKVIPGPSHASTSATTFVKEEEEVKPKAKATFVEGSSGARNLVSDERQEQVTGSFVTTLPRAQSQLDAIDDSQKWEEVNSPTTSSYPSMTFPEQTATPPAQFHPAPQTAPQSVTLSVFDSSLSTRTRLKALVSSLAINLLLPFVNGVMLGFGEIFAKNFILGRLGWGATAANVGIGSRQQFKQPGFR